MATMMNERVGVQVAKMKEAVSLVSIRLTQETLTDVSSGLGSKHLGVSDRLPVRAPPLHRRVASLRFRTLGKTFQYWHQQSPFGIL
jgi:hypothetical protein